MKSFDNIDDMWIDAIDEVHGEGRDLESRAGSCQEVIGYSARLTDLHQNFLTNPMRKLSSTYAAAELAWYLARENDITRLQHYAPKYGEFVGGQIADGAYGYRWAHNPGFEKLSVGRFDSQLETAFSMLSGNLTSRQVVVAQWDSGDIIKAHDKTSQDLPCTLTLQFLLRYGKLNMVVNMRSNDLWRGFPYDVFCFSSIQRIMADALRVGYGHYVHSVGSLHIYDREEENCNKARAAVAGSRDGHRHDPIHPIIAQDCVHDVHNVLTVGEADGRLGHVNVDGLSYGSNNLLDDLIYCLWHKTAPNPRWKKLIRSSALREGLR